MNYTRGQWKVVNFAGNTPCVMCQPEDKRLGENLIAQCYVASKPQEEQEANAKLCAASPELYEALKEAHEALRTILITHGNGVLFGESPLGKKVMAALKKAEGG